MRIWKRHNNAGADSISALTVSTPQMGGYGIRPYYRIVYIVFGNFNVIVVPCPILLCRLISAL